MTTSACDGCGSKDQCPTANQPESCQDPQQQQRMETERMLRDSLSRIKRRILVLSGKGGVGKSTVAVNLATMLEQACQQVGLLDVDIHGPSIPKLLRLENEPIVSEDNRIVPVTLGQLKVMSIGFLLQNRDDAVIWRGPMKYNMIQQFLANVAWGELDYLVVDAPPGTGDEPLAITQLLGHVDGAVIVTTPQDLAISDVRKCVTFCHQLNIPVLGVLENMSGFVCPHCGETVNIFKTGGGETMAHEMKVPFLGRIPIEPGIVEASDTGQPYSISEQQTPAAQAFRQAIQPIQDLNVS